MGRSTQPACPCARDMHAYKHKGEIQEYVHALLSAQADAVNHKIHDRDCRCPGDNTATCPDNTLL